ncbi:hypothetical protein BH11PSE2_BH11PSE2_02350 [soil metagenome]
MTVSPGEPAPAPNQAQELDPSQLLKRDLLFHFPSIVLVVVVAWPLIGPAASVFWAALTLGLVKAEHSLSGRRRWSDRARLVASFSLTWTISALYAFAAAVLVSRGTPAASLFSFVLLTSTVICVLLRHFHQPWFYRLAVVPQTIVLAIIAWSLFRTQLSAGKLLEALTPAATIALFVLMFWAGRSQLSSLHGALVSATRAALDRERSANAASQAKSEFLATMSHEIRTPLNGVLGMAQAMSADDISGAQRERLRVIRRCGESLLALVDDVLDLSKIETGAFELALAPFDLEHAMRGAAATFAMSARNKSLTFDFAIEDNARGAYLGDRLRVRQLLHNLISNAVKFTDAGWVTVRISSEYEAIRLEVADSGIGMTPVQIERLFDKFVQMDGSATRRHGGAGLGLVICQELARAMGGRIEVTSEPGEGSLFTVILPLQRLGDDTAPVSTGFEAANAPRDPEAPLRVLAAEDNPVNQQVLKLLLQQVGIEPVITVNGREAVEAWRDGEWDLVLMDIQMPEMDGVTATRTIRAEEVAAGRRRTPILAVTANAMNHQAAEYDAVGMDGLVPKPIELTKLVAAIERVLSAAEQSAAVA